MNEHTAAIIQVTTWTDDLNLHNRPYIFIGKCATHELTNHYCPNRIHISSYDLTNVSDLQNLRHEFVHHVFAQIKQYGALSQSAEETFIDMFVY